MKRSAAVRILPVLGILLAAGCNDTPTAISPDAGRLENGGSYGSGGRAATGESQTSTSSVTGDELESALVAEMENGGSYGSGGR